VPVASRITYAAALHEIAHLRGPSAAAARLCANAGPGSGLVPMR
jgi:hypothetical protein